MSPERSIRQTTNRGLTVNRETGQILVPSRELAWLIGTLAGKGSVEFDPYRIQLTSSTEPLLSEFKLVGESIFGLNADYKPETHVKFYSRRFAAALGNLRRSEWPKTIKEQHPWLLDNQRYTWAFLEGLYDTIGTSRIAPGRRRVVFAATYIDAANSILELLARLGIQNPKLSRDRTYRVGLRGVVVENVRDIQSIAENIRSRVPLQEERLSSLRSLNLQGEGSERNYPSSIEELIQEWTRLTNLLGHVPTRDEITEGRKLKKTRFSAEVYTHRFSGSNSFTETKNVIEEMIRQEGRISDEDINQLLRNYEQETGVQIRFTPKLHRSPEDEARKRLEQLLQEPETPQFSPVLVSLTGNPFIPSHKQIEYFDRLNAEDIARNEIEPGVEVSSRLESKGIPVSVLKIGETFNKIGYVGRRIFYLLAQSKEPISSSQLAHAVYGDEIDLTVARQRIRMCIYKVLNPRLKEKGFSVVNMGEAKTHWEALYSLIEPEMINSSNLPFEQLMRWNEKDDIFEVNLPDEQIFKVKDMLKVKLVAMLIQSGELSMEELTGEFFGTYNSRTSDNVGHLVKRTNGLFELMGWGILQTTTPRELRLGQKAKYSLKKDHSQLKRKHKEDLINY